MRFKNRFLAGAAVVALATGGAIVAVAGPASAVTPTGGCWVYTPSNAANMEDTVPASQTSSSLAPWANPGPADYTLTTSGSSMIGGTRNFSLTFNEGPTNGGPPASGVVYYYFSVNGVNLPAVSKPFSAGGAAPIPGDTVTGSFTVSSVGNQTLRLRKVFYDIPSFSTRVACNGQSTGIRVAPSGGVNPATTPLDTNITASFTSTGPVTTISAVSNQVVTTAGRAGDAISYSGVDFQTDGAGTIALCNEAGSSCDTGAAVTITGGAVSGSYTIPGAATTGDRALKITDAGGLSSLTDIKVLSYPTFGTNLPGGGSGTVVTVSGDNWDPNSSVIVRGYQAGGGQPPATTDAQVTLTADADGELNGTYTVSDSTTAQIGFFRQHKAGPPPVILTGVVPFTFSGDSCQAKVGAATTGSCSLLQTMRLTVTAGNLTTSKVAGDVIMDGIQLNGQAQVSQGELNQVTVKDYRGGSLGWSLTGKFSGLTGPATIAPTKLSWTPTCTKDATNNDDTVTTGAAGAVFADANTGVPVCTVAVSGLGPDGTSGGDTKVDADLELSLGANQAAGNYIGTITLTLS